MPSPGFYTCIGSGLLIDKDKYIFTGVALSDSLYNIDYFHRITSITKYDTSGNCYWRKQLHLGGVYTSNQSFESAYYLAKDRHQNYVFFGHGNDSITNETPFLYTFNAQGDSVGFIGLSHGVADNHYFSNALMIDSFGNYIVGGDYWNNRYGDTVGYWIEKIDSNGQSLWRRAYLDTPIGAGSTFYKIMQANDGVNYISTLITPPIDTAHNMGFEIVKIDTAGNLLWQMSLPKSCYYTNLFDYNYRYFDVIPAINGSGYYFFATLPVHVPSLDYLEFAGTYYIGKIDNEGQLVWTKQLQHDSTYNEYSKCIMQRPNGDLIFTGRCDSAFGAWDVDGGGGYGYGTTTFCTDSLGNVKWSHIHKHANCTNENTFYELTGAALTEGGSIFNAGYLFAGNSIQTSCFDTAGNMAYWVKANSEGIVKPSDTVFHYTLTAITPCLDTGVNQNQTAAPAIPSVKAVITIYPNPTQNTLFIKSSNVNGQVLLYNMWGVLIKSKYIKANTVTEMSMSGLPAGSYLVKVISNGTMVYRQIITKEG